MTSRYLTLTDTDVYSNPYLKVDNTYQVESEWTFGLGPQKGGPHNVSNPKRFDRRRADLLECTPDIWTQRFRDGASGEIRDVTHTRFKHHALEQSNYEPYGGYFENLRNMAIDHGLENLRQNRMENGENVGQLKQTLHEIAGASITVARSYIALKNGRFRDLAKILGLNPKDVYGGRTLTDLWLSIQYGWKPLLSDIHTGIGLATKGFRDPNSRFIRAAGRAHDTHSKVQPYGDHEFRWDTNARFQAIYYYTVGNETLDGLDSLGLLNPLSIAWELVPFSFVADWFVPVGSFLSSLTASAGLNFTAGMVSRRVDVDYYYRRKDPDLSDDRRWSSYGTWHSRTKSFGREVLSSFPLPRVYANPHPFSTPHIASAISLIRNML